MQMMLRLMIKMMIKLNIKSIINNRLSLQYNNPYKIYNFKTLIVLCVYKIEAAFVNVI